jgi:hypothetical protein
MAEGFHLEIHSIEDFITLCQQIRNEPVKPSDIASLTARLHSATDALQKAENADKKGV